MMSKINENEIKSRKDYEKTTQGYKNKLRKIDDEISNLKKLSKISFFRIFFEGLASFFIALPIGILLLIFIFYMIWVIPGLFLKFIFNVDIVSEGTLVSDFIMSILAPNGDAFFYPLLPWRYKRITFFIVIGISAIVKIQNYSQIKKFKEKMSFLNKEKIEVEEKLKTNGLVKFVDSLRNEKWGTSKQVKRWEEIDIGLNNNFADLSPYQFEEFIAKLFVEMGYDAKKTPSTGDFGADVIAKRGDETVLIEVKKYAEGNNVTPKEVQRTLGSLWKHKADKAVFITTSDFTVRAKEIEKEAPIELWNKKILHQMVRRFL